MSEQFYLLERKSILPATWGDYGSILEHGMSHTERGEKQLLLERTGPYITAVTFPGPGDIVLTSSARDILESSSLTGVSFAPVEKMRIVELHWERWDLRDDEPAEFPDSGEPEDYILTGVHDPATAEALGDLWQVVVPNSARILRKTPAVRSFMPIGEVRLERSSWNGADLLRSDDVLYTFCTARAKDWFLARWGLYVGFQSVETT